MVGSERRRRRGRRGSGEDGEGGEGDKGDEGGVEASSFVVVSLWFRCGFVVEASSFASPANRVSAVRILSAEMKVSVRPRGLHVGEALSSVHLLGRAPA